MEVQSIPSDMTTVSIRLVLKGYRRSKFLRVDK